MKYSLTVFAFILFSFSAWAVSLDFPQWSAVTIGDVEVVKNDEATETSIKFSGDALGALYNFLPEVGDLEKEDGAAASNIRGFDIFSSDEKSPSQKLNFQCEKNGSSVDCRITITKGVIAG